MQKKKKKSVGLFRPYQARIRREVNEEVVGIARGKCAYDQDGERVFERDGSERCSEGPSGREESSVRKEALASDFAQDTRLADRLHRSCMRKKKETVKKKFFEHARRRSVNTKNVRGVQIRVEDSLTMLPTQLSATRTGRILEAQ